MMTRLRSAVALTVLLAAVGLLPAAAQAKEVMSLQACGPDGCTDILGDRAPGHVVLEGGPPTDAPARATPFLRLRYGVGDGRQLMERFTVTLLPASGMMRNEAGDWMRLDPEGAALLRRLTRGIERHPAERLDLPGAARPPAREPAPVVAGDGGLPGWLLPVGVALLAAVALVPLARARRAPAG